MQQPETVLTRLQRAVSRVRGALFGEQRSEASGKDLADETIVRQLLARRDGKMKQASVISETDWSASKVSRVLSSMEERGAIERVRIGRQKIVVDSRERGEDG